MRQGKPPAEELKNGVDRFMRRVVIPRRKKLSQLGDAWRELLPAEIVEHSCLESFRGGQLRVLVDSAAHMAELNLLIREGLSEQIRQMCPNLPLSKIKLVRGSWYYTNEEGNRIAIY